MKLTIDTSEELNAEQLYGLYVAAKKKEKTIETESKSYKNGFDAGYAKCHRDYYFNQCVTYTSGKEDGYKEGYEKAKSELHDEKKNSEIVESVIRRLDQFVHDYEMKKLKIMEESVDEGIKRTQMLLERAKEDLKGL